MLSVKNYFNVMLSVVMLSVKNYFNVMLSVVYLDVSYKKVESCTVLFRYEKGQIFSILWLIYTWVKFHNSLYNKKNYILINALS